jgi:ATP synthase protein I
MVRAPSTGGVLSQPAQKKREAMSNAGPDPERLKALGRKLDDVQKRGVRPKQTESTSPANIAFRLSTELAVALVVGGAFGWGIDWLFGFFGIHTRPIFIIVFFLLGAVAGIRNVMRVAKEINAQFAAGPVPPAVKDDEE